MNRILKFVPHTRTIQVTDRTESRNLEFLFNRQIFYQLVYSAEISVLILYMQIFMSLGSGLHYKPHGLPQREIDHLPCRIFSRSTDYRDIKHCFICNCRFKEGEELKLL